MSIGVFPGANISEDARSRLEETAARVVAFDLRNDESVRLAVAHRLEAVVHLAAVSSGAMARRDPGLAWEVNAAGTARLAQALAATGRAVRLMVVSTGEVYGRTERFEPCTEAAALVPASPYAASKVGAEIAALEVHRRCGLDVVVARPFGHTGAGQEAQFVVPAFARRILEAKRGGAESIRVGNLDPIREFMHVSDVVEAYCELVGRGKSGEAYNIASGRGQPLREVFEILADVTGFDGAPEVDAELVRTGDIPYLVGDSTKLRALCGWKPKRSVRDTLAEVANAQAN